MKASLRRLWVVVPLAAVLLISAPLSADDGVDDGVNSIDLTSGLPPGNVEITPLPDNDPVYNVLWDLTHGVYLSYEPGGTYSNIVVTLASNGYVTTTTDAGIQNIDLSTYDIIVLCIGSAWDSPYTAPEVQAVQDFIASGGAVLVMSENTDCPNENLNPVTEAFGVTCGVSYLSPSDLYFTNFAPHQIFDGVTTVYYRAAGEVAATGPAIAIAWTSAGEETVASVEPCQMIVTSDANFCDNDYWDTVDNLQFTLNIFDCLATGTTPVEPSTWGAVKSIFR